MSARRLDHYIPDVRGLDPLRQAADPVPGYWDRFGNIVSVGSLVILARSGSGSLALGCIVDVTPTVPGRWPVVGWKAWDHRWDRNAGEFGEWVESWGPRREINPVSTVRYFGVLPGQNA